jgi:hypothetical protein
VLLQLILYLGGGSMALQAAVDFADGGFYRATNIIIGGAAGGGGGAGTTGGRGGNGGDGIVIITCW